MQVAIDKFGRMVLPKSIRDDFGLVPGSVLDVEEQSKSIVLKPLDQESVVREEGGVWVYGGDIEADPRTELKRLRDERLGRLE